MKRKLFFGLLVFTLVASSLFAACAAPAPAPTPTPTPTPTTPTPTPTPEVIELKFASTSPSVIPQSQLYQQWATKVEEQSGGRVKITFYWAGSLLQAPEMFQGVLAGVTDIGEVWADVVESMALNKFNTLPFLGLYPEETATIIYRELLNKFPALTEEYQGLKLLYPCCWGGRQWVHTTKKLITSREDMKGVKFIGSGGTAEWLDLMGAVPVNVFFQDWYTSLQKGLVEGTVGNWPPINASGSTLLLKYHTGISVPLTISAAPVIMNPASWNRLPPDIQKIFEDLDSWFVETRINFVARQQNEDIYKRTLEAGDTYVELSPEEMQSWVDVAKPLHEKWIEEMEAKGKPGRALYEELQRLMKEYSKK